MTLAMAYHGPHALLVALILGVGGGVVYFGIFWWAKRVARRNAEQGDTPKDS